MSSPPRPADIGDGPGAGKCLSIIKNGCSVMQEETSKTCHGVSSSVPGFAVVCGRAGCHPPAVSICTEKISFPPKFWNFSYSAIFWSCSWLRKLLVPGPVSCSCLSPLQGLGDFLSPSSWCHQAVAAAPFQCGGVMQIRRNHWILKDSVTKGTETIIEQVLDISWHALDKNK